MPKTILIIDDDDQFRIALSGVLGDAGYEVVEAANGKAAINMIDHLRETIDLMVVDICLPDMNGLEIIGAVTRQPRSVKVIATSAVFGQMFLDVATTVGANVGLRKPGKGQQPQAGQWLHAVRGLLGEIEPVERPTRRVALVVQPNRGLRAYLSSVLQQDGLQVLEAANGEDALALFEKVGGAIDVLIAEVDMAPTDGVALAQAIRGRAPNLPVVYICSSDEPQGAELHNPGRKIVFVPRPLAPGALTAALAQVMPKHPLRDGVA